jgi:hypothetical protein
MKDLYYRAAAELTVASNSGWEYLADKHITTKINEVKDEKEIAELPIFVNVINPLLKTAAFFVILLAGWRLITQLSKNSSGDGNIMKAIRSVIPLLLVAIILWDFTIVFSIVNVVQGLASNLGGSLDKLTD